MSDDKGDPPRHPLHDAMLVRPKRDTRRVNNGEDWVVDLNLANPKNDDSHGYLAPGPYKLGKEATAKNEFMAAETPKFLGFTTVNVLPGVNNFNWDSHDVDSFNPGGADYFNGGANDLNTGNRGYGDSNMDVAHDTEGGQASRSGCFNCGQDGHNKADCPNERVPREFTGTCHTCGQTGHQKNACPNALLKVCKNCEQEGHEIMGCTNPRKTKYTMITAKTPEEAWAALVEAADDGDLTGAKQAIHEYSYYIGDITYPQMELALRKHNIRLYLVAIESDAPDRFTHMDLQGNLGRQYLVTFRKGPNATRAAERSGWPKSTEENMERLANAGHLVDCLMPKCNNCGALGHIKKHCKEELTSNHERVELSCFNCGKVGHRQRDCPEARVDKFACKNCGGGGHVAKECTEPTNMDNVTCKECNEKGHFVRDCPTKPQVPCFNCGQTGHRKADCTNEAVQKCRNCDEEGHISKECPKPRDYSRVTCRNCGEKGHTQVKCRLPPKEAEDAGVVGGENNYANDSFGNVGGTYDAGETALATDDTWNSNGNAGW